MRAGSQGLPIAAWLTTTKERGRTHQRAWLATISSDGKLLDRQLIFHTLGAPYPKRGAGWNSACPTLAPGEGKELDAIWQRVRTFYYPGNQLSSVDRPSELVRRSRSASGRWSGVRRWLQASRSSRWTWPEETQWHAGEGRSGTLLVQRRTKSGPKGLRVDVARRLPTGKWGPFRRDPSGLGAGDLVRSVAGHGSRLAMLTAAPDSGVRLRLMGPPDTRWQTPRLITASPTCRRDGGKEMLQLRVIADGGVAAWPCRFPGGSSAVEVVKFDPAGAVLGRWVVGDDRAAEAAAVEPLDSSNVSSRRSTLSIGGLSVLGTSALVSWSRKTPYAPYSQIADVHEATIDSEGVVSERKVIVGNAVAPALPANWQRSSSYDGQSPTRASGLNPGSDVFLLGGSHFPSAADFALLPVEEQNELPNRWTVAAKRGTDGEWRTVQWWDLKDFALSYQRGAAVGDALVLPGQPAKVSSDRDAVFQVRWP